MPSGRKILSAESSRSVPGRAEAQCFKRLPRLQGIVGSSHPERGKDQLVVELDDEDDREPAAGGAQRTLRIEKMSTPGRPCSASTTSKEASVQAPPMRSESERLRQSNSEPGSTISIAVARRRKHSRASAESPRYRQRTGRFAARPLARWRVRVTSPARSPKSDSPSTT